MWGVVIAVLKLAHQKSKPVILLSQVKLAGKLAIDSIRDRHELLSIIQCNSFYVYLCDEILHKITTQLPLS